MLPKLLSSNPAKLAEINSQIDTSKLEPAWTPRAFDELALGLKYEYHVSRVMKIATVAVARETSSYRDGSAGRIAGKWTVSRREISGQTIYVFTLNQQVRVLGLPDLRIRELPYLHLTATHRLGDVPRCAAPLKRVRELGDGTPN